MYFPFRNPAWNAEGKHVFITGGSQGLGLAVARKLSREGADVTIVARTVSKLEKAAAEIMADRKSNSQTVAFYPADLGSFAGAAEALKWAASSADGPSTGISTHLAARPVGRVPDAVICCAGGAKPGWFIEQKEEDFKAGFQTDYMTALSTAHAAARLMTATGVKGKIVLVSSTLGLIGLVGYSQYSPMKFAVRGLAETLRSELLLYEISVHCYFPGTILSPGYEIENRTKPKLTQNLEGPPKEGLTPDQCARGLLSGLKQGKFFITTDFQTELFRTATATGGSIPSNNWLLDRGTAFIALIGLPLWRRFVHDRAIRAHAQEHSREVGRRVNSLISSKPHGPLFLLCLSHRLAILACLAMLPLVVQPFDTSAELLTVRSVSGDDTIWRRLASNLIRWDSIHFLGAASPSSLPAGSAGAGGYRYESTLAFQPGLVWLLRLCGSQTGLSWSWTQAVVVVSALAVLLSAATPPLLYRVVRHSVPHRPSIALASSLLCILSPSPATLVSPTPEPFFCFFALLGMILIVPSPPGTDVAVGAVFRAAISFAVATSFRANGVLLVGFLAYTLLWHRPSGRPLAPRLLLALPLSVGISVAPFALGQYWAWSRFCQPSLDASQQRPWCRKRLSCAYAFVQSEYWDVGFMRYWRVSQLPNFAFASPVLLMAGVGAWKYLSGTPKGLLRHLAYGWLWPARSHVVDGDNSASPTTFGSSPMLLPHMILSAVYFYLLLFQSHTQIALRFASPAWVGLWISVGDAVTVGDARMLSATTVLWLVSWNLISVVLYSAFLPPA